MVVTRPYAYKDNPVPIVGNFMLWQSPELQNKGRNYGELLTFSQFIEANRNLMTGVYTLGVK